MNDINNAENDFNNENVVLIIDALTERFGNQIDIELNQSKRVF